MTSKNAPRSTIRIVTADLSDPVHADALVALLDAYAKDPAGGGEGLSPFAKEALVPAMRARPTMYSVLAFDGEVPVGLVNAIEGFSTFACKPLVNIHDVTVMSSHRGRGIAGDMLSRVADLARERGACKMTLEVLAGNTSAVTAYARLGFAPYALDPAMGEARFMQLWFD